MTKFRTHYDTLQISRSAGQEVIKAAYRTLSARYHPDRNAGDPRSAEMMSMLNSAYSVLSDDKARRDHDAWIKRQEGAGASRRSPQAAGAAAHDQRNPTPAWGSDPGQWVSPQSRSAATEAALTQGRFGKLAALTASAAAACLLVFALISEYRATTGGLAQNPDASVSGPAARQNGPALSLATRRDAPPKRVIDAATAFARREGLLNGASYTVRIHDDGEAWLISYRRPAERKVAAPIVLIDKETQRVIGYYAAGG